MTQLDKVNIISKPYSDETAKIIDKEISLLIESQYQKRNLEESKDKLNQLADIQLKRSYLKDDLETIFEKSF
jgi:cell division protease FtsH